MLDVEVIEDPAAATVGLARQKVNYHLRTLEAHGLVEPAGERR